MVEIRGFAEDQFRYESLCIKNKPFDKLHGQFCNLEKNQKSQNQKKYILMTYGWQCTKSFQWQKNEKGEIYGLENGEQNVEPIEQLPFFIVQEHIFIIKGEYDKVQEFCVIKVFSQGKDYEAYKEHQSHPVQRISSFFYWVHSVILIGFPLSPGLKPFSEIPILKYPGFSIFGNGSSKV